jgi:hypothetical protein
LEQDKKQRHPRMRLNAFEIVFVKKVVEVFKVLLKILSQHLKEHCKLLKMLAMLLPSPCDALKSLLQAIKNALQALLSLLEALLNLWKTLSED